jgi:hypothetical protein
MKSVALALTFLVLIQALSAQVNVESVPESGLQPQVVVSSEGVVHLVYLKGDPKGCDIRYTHRAVDDVTWAVPITVNSIAKTAVAMGTIRGAQLALGKSGSVQVVWNGAPDHAGGRPQRSPLYHARLESRDSVFNTQQDLLGGTVALDGGATIAADTEGRVCIIWHATTESGKRENSRLIFLRESTDDGRRFSAPLPLNSASPGVCPCCSLRAHLDGHGTLSVLYRTAFKPDARGMAMITYRKDKGAAIKVLDDWRIAMCPMSSVSLMPVAQTLRAAWENDGQIVTGFMDSPVAFQKVGPKNAKHPALAQNAKGQTVIVSVLGAGWAKAGHLHWDVLDKKGNVSSSEDGEKLPVWSFAVAYARTDGHFVILR